MIQKKVTRNGSRGLFWRWVIVIAITLLSGTFVFLGPDTHSNVEDAPTYKSKLGSILIIFLISGAIFLQVRGKSTVYRINQGIVGLCALMVSVVVIANIPTLGFDFSSSRVIFGWVALLVGMLFLAFLIRKLRSAFISQ